jgi:hypothetical protein
VAIARRRLHAFVHSRARRREFENIHTYCLFIGHARGGGSLMGALLDAHPNALVADEVDILAHLRRGYDMRAVFARMRIVAARQAGWRHRRNRRGRRLPYGVEGQWQGRYRELHVIGSSQAGPTSRNLSEDLARVAWLREQLGDIRLRALQVVRNPFDAIGSMMLRSGRPLGSGIERYFSNCAAVSQVRQAVGEDSVLLVRYEQLLAEPDATLHGVLSFLDLAPEPDYVASATAVVGTGSRDRYRVAWTPEAVELVMTKAAHYPFLAGYRFDEETRLPSPSTDGIISAGG